MKEKSFLDKEDNFQSIEKEEFEALNVWKSKWTLPPKGYLTSKDFFANTAATTFHKLISNLSK